MRYLHTVLFVLITFQFFGQSMSDFAPSYSPDGEKIAFYSYRYGKAEIMMMNADGSDQKRLTFDQETQDFEPVWSPKGGRIAFIKQLPEVSQIALYDLKTGEVELLTSGQHLSFSPAWSPDGDEITFYRQINDAEEIFVLNVKEKRERQITSNGFRNTYPSWSFDGKYLAYTSSREERQNDIYVHNIQTGEEINITNSTYNELGAKWSPKSNDMIFVSNKEGSDIYSIHIDGSNYKKVLDTPASEFFPTWHPSGYGVAFTSNVEGGNEIYALEIGSEDYRNLTQTTTFNKSPIKGEKDEVYFISKRDRNAEIYLKVNDGVQRITHTTGDEEGPISYSQGAVFYSRNDSVFSLGRSRIERFISIGNSPSANADATQLTFVKQQGDFSQLVHRTLKTGKERQLTQVERDHEHPKWVDANTILLYSNDRNSADCFLLDIHSGLQTKVTDGKGLNYNPDLSPDKERVLFTSNRNGRRLKELFIVNIKTKALEQVTDQEFGRVDNARWIDDQTILFDSNMDRNYHVYSYHLPSKTLKRLTKPNKNDEL